MRWVHVAPEGGISPALLGRVVLVVEDELLVRETVVDRLLEAGFQVLEAETAEEGLDIIEQRSVSVLFTDIRLPGAMDGWQLGEEARKRHGGLAVVYATGYSSEEPRPVPNGVFLRKPYLPSQVVGIIGRLLEGDG